MEDTTPQLSKKEQHELDRQAKVAGREQAAKGRVLKHIALWLGILLLCAGAIWGLMKLGASSGGGIAGALAEPVSLTDWSKGAPGASVVLVEYSDFQCPACGSFYPFVKDIATKYKDQVLVVYRHFPLIQHKQARLAAQAAEAAGFQGKFWEMHDKLFENQASWSGNSNAEQMFIIYARELGLNEAAFASALKSSESVKKIDADLLSGERSQVNSTPTFFLNGKKLTNLSSFADLEYEVKQALDSK